MGNLAKSDDILTLMAVHAHPDDEASSTGGILAKYSAEGARTVVVTCTNGEMGDGPGGVKPGENGHDEDSVAAMRRRELEKSCQILGVSHLEVLGYRDSGMMGWPTNEAPGAFWGLPVDVAAEPLERLMGTYRPQVVVTYDDSGFYGHPDHIQAHRITLAALEATRLPAKLYYVTIRRSRLALFAQRMAQAGVQPPQVDDPQFGSADEDIAASIDCSAYAAMKREALAAHSSQSDNIFFLNFSLPVFTELFGTEEFVRGHDPMNGPLPEDDLFFGRREVRDQSSS